MIPELGQGALLVALGLALYGAVAAAMAGGTGRATIPVRHTGTAPDLFGEGRGAVVEGRWTADGYFKATQILAKHSEEYKAPHDAANPGYQELMKTLRSDQK